MEKTRRETKRQMIRRDAIAGGGFLKRAMIRVSLLEKYDFFSINCYLFFSKFALQNILKTKENVHLDRLKSKLIPNHFDIR